MITPVLKWAGGKRWAISAIMGHAPATYNRYIEPFIGGGSTFFALGPQAAIIGDSNWRLINAYRAMKECPDHLTQRLAWYQAEHSKEFYYCERDVSYDSLDDEAARFIYLNRTCWNGLYRENRLGQFNVPIGTKDRIEFTDGEIHKASDMLSNASILCSDFESVVDLAGDGDFVYCDPPYTVAHNFNGFIKYNQKIFSWDDQIRLRDACDRAVARGAHILVSNADHESVRTLYGDFSDTLTLSRSSVIAAQSKNRRSVGELLVIGRPN